MSETYNISLTVNGQLRHASVKPGATLSELLRETLGLTGSKVSCNTGDCGACTVIMNKKAVKSCIIPAMKADGAVIETIEGISGDEPHPLQTKFVEHAAVQCGYCIPGMIMAAKACLDEIPNPTVEQARESISGNICRCTGYVKPVQAIMSAAEEINGRAK